MGKSKVILRQNRQLVSLVLSALLLASTSVMLGGQEAGANIFKKFGSKLKSGLSHLTARLPRSTTASKVSLVQGNPPALYWKTASDPKAALLCLHELGLHKGVFENLGRRMSEQGVAVYAIDLRGFGEWRDVQSKDARMDLDLTLADVKAAVEAMRKNHPGIPIFILGEAMGGALALKAASDFPELIQGAITAAPGGEHYEKVHDYIKVGSGMVAGANKDSGLGEALMNRATAKSDLRETFEKDDLVRLDVTPRELMACQFFMYKTKNMARQIKDTPVLVVHGEQDRESRPVGSTNVYEQLATKDKEYLVVKDGDHYTFEDNNVSDQAFNYTLAWIDKHAKTK
jgi:acylglycerol lipase